MKMSKKNHLNRKSVKREENMIEFLGCTIHVDPQHMSAIVRVESSGNPYAIGIVGHYLSRQPRNVQEALEVVDRLVQDKYNYSVGLSQINKTNFAAQNLSKDNMFDACDNLQAGSLILKSVMAASKIGQKPILAITAVTL